MGYRGLLVSNHLSSEKIQKAGQSPKLKTLLLERKTESNESISTLSLFFLHHLHEKVPAYMVIRLFQYLTYKQLLLYDFLILNQ